MKGFVIFLLLLFGAHTVVTAQKDVRGSALLKKGLSFYSQNSYTEALKVFDKIVKDKDKVSEHVYAAALFNVPKIYMETGKPQQAKEGYNKVISSDVRDTEATGDELNAFANYKHNASLNLAQLNYNDSDFATALSWLYKADTLYPYYAPPENPTAAIKGAAGILSWEVMLLQRLDRPGDAIQRIIYELVCAQQFGGYFNAAETELIRMVGDNKAGFKKELDTALENIAINALDDKHEEAIFVFRNRTYRFHLTNEEPPNAYIVYRRLFVMAPGRKMDAHTFARRIRSCTFYKRLVN